MPGFERFDGVDVAQCHCDIVEACEQTLLARRIDREVEARAVGGCDGLRRQIDGDPCSWITAAIIVESVVIMPGLGVERGLAARDLTGLPQRPAEAVQAALHADQTGVRSVRAGLGRRQLLDQ